MDSKLPAFPYGAVYFRKSNPPREDWERDYKTAREDGLNIFRHWFLWSAIEVAPGKYNWSDYDRHLDLAAENGIKTIVAEMMVAAPEWAFQKYPHARYVTGQGQTIASHISPGCSTGGFPGLCLDHDEVRMHAESFLKELAGRYKNHPGLGGYDIWNECNCMPDTCYCESTRQKFRNWLEKKYGSLEVLGEAWQRYSYAGWEDVQPPFGPEPYQEFLDWTQFRKENAYELMDWRVNTIRSVDPGHPITAHGIAASLTDMAAACTDDWMAASRVEGYGFTWVASRKGNEPWKQWQAVDLVRSASRGKPFWHAESQGGHLWMQPQVLNRPREDGRISQPEDIRLWNMVSFAGGARGILNPRWRPLLDGPLFGAFGAYGMDGSRTSRSDMASRMAKWANEPGNEKLWKAKPVKGDIGIVVIPEAHVFNFAHQGNTQFYREDLWGAYQGFFDNHIQADWVHIDHIAEYDLLYLPYSLMLTQESARKLSAWVAAGGRLVSEGCPAYFGDRARACTVQPGLGLDQVFGVKEKYVEFTPDILGELTFRFKDIPSIHGGIFLQEYEPVSGDIAGTYENGEAAVVENRYGNGKTLIIGTFPGAGYYRHHGNDSKRFFASILEWAGKQPQIKCSCDQVSARIQASEEGTFLWVVNHHREDKEVIIELSDTYRGSGAADIYWGSSKVDVLENKLTVVVGGRDALVLELKK